MASVTVTMPFSGSCRLPQSITAKVKQHLHYPERITVAQSLYLYLMPTLLIVISNKSSRTLYSQRSRCMTVTAYTNDIARITQLTSGYIAIHSVYSLVCCLLVMENMILM